MAGPEVSMEFEVVEAMADAFNQSQEILLGFSKILEERIKVLEMMAFFGLPGARALAWFYEMIKPRVDALAQKCNEMDLDLMGAVVSLRDGDSSGSQRFVD